MIFSYLKIAFRNLVRQKTYTLINIFGLSAGISACIFIAAYVTSELKYDKHHKDSDKIYRINAEFDFPSQKEKLARNSMAFGPQFVSDYPEAEAYFRIFLSQKQTVRFEEKKFSETAIAFADSTLLNFFDYELLAGDPANSLNAPNSVIISDKKADLYFGSAAGAIDKLLEFQNNKYRVTGVFKTPEEETHLHYEFFISMTSLPQSVVEKGMWDYMWMLTFTYIKVHDNVTIERINEKAADFHKNRVEPWLEENNVQGKIKYHAQPLPDIHLNTDYAYDVPTKSNPLYISIFIIAGIFILAIASFNYINLITARSIKRAKEVGLRKVLGAGRKQLVYQFMGESTVITLLAYAAAFVITSSLIPVYNELTGKNITESFLFSYDLVIPLILIFIFISLVAGSYPAFYLSRFHPAQVLKIGALPSSSGSMKHIAKFFSPGSLRKMLVVLQFAISIILIIGTIVIYKQFAFIKDKDLGFDKYQVLVIDIPNDTLVSANLQTIKNELLSNPGILNISTVSNVPGTPTGVLYFNVEQEGQMADKFLNFIFIDDDYLEMMEIPFVEGRNFSKEFTTDINEAFIINEAAANILNWQEPLEKRMVNGMGKDGKVIGVVKNFNYATLHNEISPLVMMYAPVTQGFLMIKVSGQDLSSTVDFIDKKWSGLVPSHPADRFFLDDNFDMIYEKEKNLLTIFGYFASLAIIISCLGLFSLASLIAEQKTKEIGIRIILGASAAGIAALLSKDFIILVLISNIIAIPAAYYGVNKWLENFAYKADVNAWVFIIAALTALLIALVTISFRSVKAAVSNPVKSLRYE